MIQTDSGGMVTAQAVGYRVLLPLFMVMSICSLLPRIVQADSGINVRSLPRIAIIIDDLGNVSSTGRRVAGLDWPVAVSVLPHTPYAAQIAKMAHESGKEVMLHLPLQPVRESVPSGIGTIRLETSRAQLNRILQADLDSVPYIVGVNNHMGSLITQHPGHMRWLMSELKAHDNLFFVDSYTSKSSVALQLAREQGIPATRRDVFLDNETSAPAIDMEFRRLKELARQRGTAVGIGHPNLVTISYLERELPKLRQEGFRLVPISDLIAEQSEGL